VMIPFAAAVTAAHADPVAASINECDRPLYIAPPPAPRFPKRRSKTSSSPGLLPDDEPPEKRAGAEAPPAPGAVHTGHRVIGHAERNRSRSKGVCGLASAALLARTGMTWSSWSGTEPDCQRPVWRRGRTGHVMAWRSSAGHTCCCRADGWYSSRISRRSGTPWPKRAVWTYDLLNPVPPPIADMEVEPGDERFATLTGRRPVMEQAVSSAGFFGGWVVTRRRAAAR
jgi:hypothetical protein